MSNAAGESRKYTALFVAGLGAWVLNTLAASLGGLAMDAACAVLPVAWLCLALRFRTGRRWTERACTSLILAGGFLMGLCFILRLPYNFSWHDLASYSADFSGEAKPDGHLGYIAWIVENGTLPIMDPRVNGYSILYNPPLYHLIQAGFIQLNLWLRVAENVALENLQVITLLFASACPLVAVDLMSFLGVTSGACAWVRWRWRFSRRYGSLGATLNNDILSILCILACILFTVRWERTRRMGIFWAIALSMGAGMAAKLSAATAHSLRGVGIHRGIFPELKRWQRYAGTVPAFLAVSVPLAVAWPLLYHLLAFDMPLNYVRLPPRAYTWDIFPCGNGLGSQTGLPGTNCFSPACEKRTITCGCKPARPLSLTS